MIDTSIPLQVRPVQIDNPMDAYSNALRAQAMQYQLNKAQQEDATTNALNQAFAGAYGQNGQLDENALYRAIGTGPAAYKLPEVQKSIQATKEGAAKTSKEQSEAYAKLRDITGSVLTGLLGDADVQAGTPNAMPKVFEAIKSFKQYGAPDEWVSMALNSMPRDPSQLKGWLQTKASQHAQNVKQAADLVNPNVDVVNTGGQQVFVNKNAFAPGGVGQMNVPGIQNSLTPEQGLPKIQMAGDAGMQYIDPRGGGATPVLPAGQGGITNYGNMRPQGASNGFQKFGSKDEGWAALDKNLQAYASKGINTIEGIINRWAPPTENNTSAYVANVAKRLGVDPKQPLDMSDPFIRSSIAVEIARNEHPRDKLFGVTKAAQAGQAQVSDAPTVGIGGNKVKPLTEAQGNATAFGMRMQNALDNMTAISEKYGGKSPESFSPGNSDLIAYQMPMVGNFLTSDKGQQWINAEKQFISGVLRKESGAAISDSEWSNYGKMYFPRPGDTKEALEQKTENRRVAMESMKVQAGPQYDQNTAPANIGAKAKQASFDKMPDPRQYQGKTIKDDQTGQVYKSDGSKWVTVKG